MDPVIIGAVIGAVGAVAAAIITSWHRREKKKSLPNNRFFGLGNHLALLGWVKNEKTTEDKLRSVHTMTLTMMEDLRFPPRVISEFKEFLEEKVDLDRQSKMKDLAERMLTLRNLFAITIRNKFGEREENIFQFGFSLTNAVYMCENPLAMVENKNFIEDTLSALVKESHDLGLPTTPLKESFDIYRKASNIGGFTELYSKLCKCVVMYEEALEKR
jgi:hypothetical protein